MTIEIAYESKDATKPKDRFVRARYYDGRDGYAWWCSTKIGYVWCERDRESMLDVRQGTCDAEDLPEDVRSDADAHRGKAFSYVPWPY